MTEEMRMDLAEDSSNGTDEGSSNTKEKTNPVQLITTEVNSTPKSSPRISSSMQDLEDQVDYNPHTVKSKTNIPKKNELYSNMKIWSLDDSVGNKEDYPIVLHDLNIGTVPLVLDASEENSTNIEDQKASQQRDFFSVEILTDDFLSLLQTDEEKTNHPKIPKDQY